MFVYFVYCINNVLDEDVAILKISSVNESGQ